MGSSKLDVAKKQHRERSQPQHRKKLGLLEKHKDYVKRARDFHSKEDRLKKLATIAASRNKDEFYFGMVKSRTQGGVHVQDRGNEALPPDLVKLLKTQDIKYLQTQRAMEQKKILRLQESLTSIADLRTSSVLGTVLNQLDPIKGEKPTLDMLLADPSSYFRSDASTSAAPSVSNRKHIVFTENLEDLNAPLLKRAKTTSRPILGLTKSEIQAQQVEHLTDLCTELRARFIRLGHLARVERDSAIQAILLSSKGSRKEIVRPHKNSAAAIEEREERDRKERELESIKGKPEMIKGRKEYLPKPEQGLRSGARVWKWKSERKR